MGFLNICDKVLCLRRSQRERIQSMVFFHPPQNGEGDDGNRENDPLGNATGMYSHLAMLYKISGSVYS